MEEDNYKYISLSDSELSMVDEGIYTNIPTAEIDIDMSPEYSPTTEPISFSSSIKNYLPSQPSSPIQNQIDEAPLTLPIEYLSAARDWLISMVMMSEHSSNEANTSSLPIQLSTSTVNFTLPTNETESGLQLEDWISQPLYEMPLPIVTETLLFFQPPLYQLCQQIKLSLQLIEIQISDIMMISFSMILIKLLIIIDVGLMDIEL